MNGFKYAVNNIDYSLYRNKIIHFNLGKVNNLNGCSDYGILVYKFSDDEKLI